MPIQLAHRFGILDTEHRISLHSIGTHKQNGVQNSLLFFLCSKAPIEQAVPAFLCRYTYMVLHFAFTLLTLKIRSDSLASRSSQNKKASIFVLKMDANCALTLIVVRSEEVYLNRR